MAKIDQEYHKLLEKILDEGYLYSDPNRKGVNRIEIPSYTFEHNFSDGFPAITTKKTYFKGAVGELLTFLSGSTELKDLHKNSVRFWDKDAFNFYLRKNPNGTKESFEKGISQLNHIAGDLGRIYPHHMRNWEGQFDQIQSLIDGLKNNPMGTKKTVTMWNPLDLGLGDVCLSPCHWSFEALVSPINIHNRIKLSGKMAVLSHNQLDSYNVPKYQLTIKWHQHSVDTFLGFPLNCIYYSLMCYILAKLTNMVPKGIIGDLSNVHLYDPHLNAVKEQLSRDVNKYGSCELEDFGGFKMDMRGDINQWLNSKEISDFKLKGYKSYPRIPAEMLAYSD